MPQAYVRTCARCDAPLPSAPAAQYTITCSYCGSVNTFAPTSDEPAARRAGASDAALAATLTGLAQQVEQSTRLAVRAQLPQLEQELRQTRASRAELESEVETTAANIEAHRRQAARRRNGRYLLAALLLIGGAATESQVLGLLALVVWLGAWLAWRSRKAHFLRAERALFDDAAPLLTDLRRREADLAAAIHDIRRK